MSTRNKITPGALLHINDSRVMWKWCHCDVTGESKWLECGSIVHGEMVIIISTNLSWGHYDAYVISSDGTFGNITMHTDDKVLT